MPFPPVPLLCLPFIPVSHIPYLIIPSHFSSRIWLSPLHFPYPAVLPRPPPHHVIDTPSLILLPLPSPSSPVSLRYLLFYLVCHPVHAALSLILGLPLFSYHSCTSLFHVVPVPQQLPAPFIASCVVLASHFLHHNHSDFLFPVTSPSSHSRLPVRVPLPLPISSIPSSSSTPSHHSSCPLTYFPLACFHLPILATQLPNCLRYRTLVVLKIGANIILLLL